MYHPVSITHLSSAQVSKLLNGHPVRVKHGPGHHIEVSHEQHKKLQKAHSKGSASTIQFDPFQQANHQHLRGEGIKSAFKKAGRFIKSNPMLNNLAHQAISSASDYANDHGFDSSMVNSLSDMAHSELGGGSLKSFSRGIKKFANNPIVNQLGRMAINEATGGLAGMGLAQNIRGGSFKSFTRGVKKFSQNPIVNQLGRMAINEATGGLAGLGLAQNIRGGSFKSFTRGVKKFAENPIVNKLGRFAINEATGGLAGLGFGSRVGLGIKRRGRPRKMSGSALFASGYEHG